MPYTAETIPSSTIKTMLDTYWDSNAGNIPEPSFVDVNDGTEAISQNLRVADALVIRAEAPAVDERPIGNWEYGHRRARVLIEIYTLLSRQRLYDLMKEIRRICHARRHSTTGYQRLSWDSFVELNQAEFNIWAGRVMLTLENNAVVLETTT